MEFVVKPNHQTTAALRRYKVTRHTLWTPSTDSWTALDRFLAIEHN